MKMSMGSATAAGGAELFIIGRNFDRNSKVLFREYREGLFIFFIIKKIKIFLDGVLSWSAEAHINKQYLHQVNQILIKFF